MIPQHVKDQIIATASVEEVVGDYVALKRRGSNLIGLCPFHQEKTPSFTVSPAKGFFKCFGCGESGDSVSFVMKHDHLSFPEALRALAKRYNIEVPEEELTPEQLLVADEKEALFVVMQWAQRWFTEKLDTDEGKSIAVAYFKERGFRQDTIEQFQLGYAPPGWEGMLLAAHAAGYPQERLKEVGLVGEKDGRHFDFFRERVIFPIHNISGKVIAFAGRTLKTDKKQPKYINSPETAIYTKSDVLYGLHIARQAIRQEDNCLLVEGYTDVISLVQGGVVNVVASSGTALTQGQIRAIRRYTQRITLLYDGDSAGVKAAMRGVDLILEEGMQVRVAVLPEGEDPDSFMKKNGAATFRSYLEKESRDFIFFKMQLLLEDNQLDPFQRAEAIRELVQTIALIPDAMVRQDYVARLAETTKTLESTLLNELNKMLVQRKKKAAKEMGVAMPPPDVEALVQQADVGYEDETEELRSHTDTQERDLIRILLQHAGHMMKVPPQQPEDAPEEETVLDFILNEMDTFEQRMGVDLAFHHPMCARIFQMYRQAIEEDGRLLNAAHFIHHEEESVQHYAIDVLTAKYALSENWEQRHQIILDKVNVDQDVRSAFFHFVIRRVRMARDANRQEMRKVGLPYEEERALQQREMTLMKVEFELAKALKIVVMR